MVNCMDIYDVDWYQTSKWNDGEYELPYEYLGMNLRQYEHWLHDHDYSDVDGDVCEQLS